MFKEALEDFRDYFYEYPGNPIDLTSTEEELQEIFPYKKKVVEGNEDPIKMREIKHRASEKLDISKENARKRTYDLRDKSVVEKFNKSSWVRTGKFKKLSESKLKNFFVLVSVLFVIVSVQVGNPWPLFMATFLLVVSVTIFW
jgi:hypothetical protein